MKLLLCTPQSLVLLLLPFLVIMGASCQDSKGPEQSAEPVETMEGRMKQEVDEGEAEQKEIMGSPTKHLEEEDGEEEKTMRDTDAEKRKEESERMQMTEGEEETRPQAIRKAGHEAQVDDREAKEGRKMSKRKKTRKGGKQGGSKKIKTNKDGKKGGSKKIKREKGDKQGGSKKMKTNNRKAGNGKKGPVKRKHLQGGKNEVHDDKGTGKGAKKGGGGGGGGGGNKKRRKQGEGAEKSTPLLDEEEEEVVGEDMSEYERTVETTKKHPVFSFQNYLLADCGQTYMLTKSLSFLFTTDGAKIARNCITTFQSPPGTTIRFFCPVFSLSLNRCKKESVLVTENKNNKWQFCKTDAVDIETTGNSLTAHHQRKRMARKKCPGAFLCEVSLGTANGQVIYKPIQPVAPIQPEPVTVQPVYPVPPIPPSTNPDPPSTTMTSTTTSTTTTTTVPTTRSTTTVRPSTTTTTDTTTSTVPTTTKAATTTTLPPTTSTLTTTKTTTTDSTTTTSTPQTISTTTRLTLASSTSTEPTSTPKPVPVHPGPPVIGPGPPVIGPGPPVIGPVQPPAPIPKPPAPQQHQRPFCRGCSPMDITITRIVGGADAGRREFPFLLRLDIGPGTLCGGSLITREWCITASHCYSSGFRTTIVTLGEHDLSVDEPHSLKMNAIRVIKHPGHDSSSMENDIALLQLEYPVRFTEFVAPICLARSTDSAHSVAVAAGWGHTQYSGYISNVLQKVALNIITNEECQDMYITKYLISKHMLCTYTEEKDACQGDSGGPLVVKTTDGMWVLAGITSFGYKCAYARSPGVFTRVADYEEWISSNIGQPSC